jgi:hypothetical protein
MPTPPQRTHVKHAADRSLLTLIHFATRPRRAAARRDPYPLAAAVASSHPAGIR